MNLKNIIFNLLNSAVFGKTLENVKTYRYIKLVISDRRRTLLVSEPDYHIKKGFQKWKLKNKSSHE